MSVKPFDEFYLGVSSLHQIHVRQYGNPRGPKAIFLHGGPGGGCSDNDTDFFDLDTWHLTLFDQRGCGQSKPHAELKENDTWSMVGDIEAIRKRLNIDSWVAFGGSWGSTLALAYAQEHPSKVKGLILRGIFMCRQEELEWLYEGGTEPLFPEVYAEFCKPIKGVNGSSNIDKYYKLLTSEDAGVRAHAAKVWSTYEGTLAFLEPNPAAIARMGDGKFADAFARIECHYFENNGFMNESNSILARAKNLKGIPGVIVHGRYDVVCPVKNAFELKQVWPEASLHVVPSAGHASSEPGIKAKLTEACRLFSSLS